MGISNICAVTGYGDESNPIAAALNAFSRLKPNSTTNTADSQDQPMQEATAPSEAAASNNSKATVAPNTKQLTNALRLLTSTYDVVCRRFGDPNILPFLHVSLVFVHHLTFCPDAVDYVAPSFPWKLTALMLNTLLDGSSSSSGAPAASAASAQNVSQPSGLARLLQSEQFPGTGGEDAKGGEAGNGNGNGNGNGRRSKRPLPDDFAMRGFPWVEKYFPDGWFVTEERIDDDEKYFELPSMKEERRERVLWLGGRIAEREGGKWLKFDKETNRFGVSQEYEVDLDLAVTGQMPVTPGESLDYGELPDAAVFAT